mgnify:CR=1 FL=1
MANILLLKLESFDYRALDQAVSEVIQVVHRTGGGVKGPIPLPRKIKRYSVNRSPHVDKTSMEQFEKIGHERLLIVHTEENTVAALMQLSLPSVISVSVKTKGAKND